MRTAVVCSYIQTIASDKSGSQAAGSNLILFSSSSILKKVKIYRNNHMMIVVKTRGDTVPTVVYNTELHY